MTCLLEQNNSNRKKDIKYFISSLTNNPYDKFNCQQRCLSWIKTESKNLTTPIHAINYQMDNV